MSSIDDVGASPESTPSDEGFPFEERPTTRADWCHSKPLDDSVEDCYRLHEPITDAPSIVGDDRYLEEGEPMKAFEAVGSCIKRRRGENVSVEKHGFHKTRQWRRMRQYALGKAMDRQFLDVYENPTTVLLSLRVSDSMSSLYYRDELASQKELTLNQEIGEIYRQINDALILARSRICLIIIELNEESQRCKPKSKTIRVE